MWCGVAAISIAVADIAASVISGFVVARLSIFFHPKVSTSTVDAFLDGMIFAKVHVHIHVQLSAYGVLFSILVRSTLHLVLFVGFFAFTSINVGVTGVALQPRNGMKESGDEGDGDQGIHGAGW